MVQKPKKKTMKECTKCGKLFRDDGNLCMSCRFVRETKTGDEHEGS